MPYLKPHSFGNHIFEFCQKCQHLWHPNMIPSEQLRVLKLKTPYTLRCNLVHFDYGDKMANSPGREYADGRRFAHQKFVQPENCAFKLEYLMKHDETRI